VGELELQVIDVNSVASLAACWNENFTIFILSAAARCGVEGSGQEV